MPEIAITVLDADDEDFVEQEVGTAFYTHLRGLDRLADARHGAVERAIALYEGTGENDASEPELAGTALLVFQRTALICEDILALLWSLGRKDVWSSFTGYYMRDLTKTAVGYLEGNRNLHRFFLVPDDEAVAAQGLSPEQAAAVQALARATRAGHDAALQLVCAFWASHNRLAKATMHGFGMVARKHLTEPPGAGFLGQFLDLAPPDVYAAVPLSELDDEVQTVSTQLHWVELDRSAVERYRRTAVGAANLLTSLRLAQLSRLARKTAWYLHGAYLDEVDHVHAETLRSMSTQRRT